MALVEQSTGADLEAVEPVAKWGVVAGPRAWGLGEWWVANSYRPLLRDQAFLLSPDMRDWLPADHVVWLLLDTWDAVDTSAFDRCRRLGGVGAPGCDPGMLLDLLM